MKQARKSTKPLLDNSALHANILSLLCLCFKDSGLPTIITNEQGQTYWINDAFSNLTEYSLEEMSGLKPGELLQGSDTDVVTIKRLSELIANFKCFDAEILNYSKQGTPYWVHLYGSPISDPQGKPIGFLAFQMNMTQAKGAQKELILNEDRLRKWFNLSPIGIALTDFATGTFLEVNNTLLVQTGYKKEELLRGSHWDLIPRNDYAKKQEELRVLSTTDSYCPPYKQSYRRKDGTTYPVIVNSILTSDASGSDVIMSTIQDISEHNKYIETLQLMASVFQYSGEAIMITSKNSKILDVNNAFTVITGYSREEVLGKNPSILRSGKHTKEFYESIWKKVRTKGHWRGEIWNKSKDGSLYAELLSISAVPPKFDATEIYVAIFSDITLVKEQQSRLEYMAYYDVLTGLPNRRLLDKKIRESMIQARKLVYKIAVISIDLDGFKEINDTLGHNVGDELLRVLSQRWMQNIGENDILSRIGGDEFVVLMHDFDDINQIVMEIEQLLVATGLPISINGVQLKINASAGITIYPQDDLVDADHLLRQADQAMCQSKLAGKNCYHFFDIKQDRHARSHHESLDRIQKALTNREFVLFYQPKIDLRTGKLVGTEALIRWQHPQLGLLPPANFLPIIANNPLAIELGEWVIDTALCQIDSWREQGLSIPVSVNVDAIQLQDPDFISRLRILLDRHPGINSGQLELEVLETSLLEDLNLISDIVDTCKKMGVNFSLDDFGTGYSSILYLKRLSAKTLKVDQCFVRDMLLDPDDVTILNVLLILASSFCRDALAEGIETELHGEILLRIGYQYGQGYAIARPMPADKLQHWMSTWKLPSSWVGIKPIKQDLMPVLIASIAFRAWHARVVTYLSGKSLQVPQSILNTCPLVNLNNKERMALMALNGINDKVDLLLIQIQRLVDELVETKHHGRELGLESGLDELEKLKEELIEENLTLLWT